jgi:hypothetical protein
LKNKLTVLEQEINIIQDDYISLVDMVQLNQVAIEQLKLLLNYSSKKLSNNQ